MANPTLKLLRQLSQRMVRDWMHNDDGGCALLEHADALDRAFKARHRHNAALLWEVTDLLDAYLLQASVESERRFYLGLQMGLELGSLDLLPRED